MSGGAWNYLSYRFREGDIPVSWIPVITDALADIEHDMDWAVSCDTSKDKAIPLVWDRLVKLFEDLSGER